jgi:hypothetical protein
LSDADGELNFERRRYPRFNVKLPVEFTIVAENRRCRAVVDNISLAGVLILTDEKLEQGTPVIVHLPGGPTGLFDIEASIVRTSVVGEFGVAFGAMSQDEIEWVTSFVENRSAL